MCFIKNQIFVKFDFHLQSYFYTNEGEVFWWSQILREQFQQPDRFTSGFLLNLFECKIVQFGLFQHVGDDPSEGPT